MTVHEIEPRRWADDPAGGALSELLRDARGDLPDGAAVSALEARLGLDAPNTGNAGSSPVADRHPASPSPWVAGRPWIAGIAAAAAVGLGVYLAPGEGARMGRQDDRLVPAPEPASPSPAPAAAGSSREEDLPEAPALAPAPPAPAVAVPQPRSRPTPPPPPPPSDPEPQPARTERTPTGDDAVADPQAPLAAEAPDVSASPPDAPTAEPPPSEIALIARMRRSLGTSPATTLEAVRAHARHYPDGQMAPERRVYEILAVAAQGRRAEARRLESAFRRDHPGFHAYDGKLADALHP